MSRPIFFFSPTRRPPRSPLFPYTTLLRSRRARRLAEAGDDVDDAVRQAGLEHQFAEPQRRERGLHGHLQHHRSEEHTSELQSRPHLVCRLLLEKKKTKRSNA